MHVLAHSHLAHRRMLVVKIQEGAAGSRQPVLLLGHPDQVDSGVRTQFSQASEARPVDLRFIDDDQHARHDRGGHLLVVLQGAPDELITTLGLAGRHQLLQLVGKSPTRGGVGRQMHRQRRVRRTGVRQPFKPLPGSTLHCRGQAANHQLGGRVQTGGLHDHRPGHTLGVGAGTTNAQRADRTQVCDDRCAGQLHGRLGQVPRPGQILRQALGGVQLRGDR